MEMEMEMEMDIQRLPEDCISHVIVLTGPRDACRSAAVSTTFRSAAVSDGVWEQFLPPDYERILARAVGPVECASKRELYFRLCDQPLLLDSGRMSFALEKSSGAKCYMLSARALTIAWGDCPEYWRWIPVPHSSTSIFPEAAELLNVCWLDIHGKIDSKALSPRTTYAAYLVFKLTDDTDGLTYPAQEASVSVGNHLSTRNVCLNPHYSKEVCLPRRFSRYGHLSLLVARRARQASESAMAKWRGPVGRRDGWMEMELGEFRSDHGDDGEIDMSLTEVRGGQWKTGLVVYGIEIRPKETK